MKSIHKSEQKYLISNKLREGKDLDEAIYEVTRDLEFIKGASNLDKENKKLNTIIEYLKNQVIELRLKLKEKNKEAYNNSFKKFNDSNSNKPTTIHLNRILLALQDSPEQYYEELKKNCMVNDRDLFKQSMGFLESWKFIEKSSEKNERNIDVCKFKLVTTI